jgi:hypothetical protein
MKYISADIETLGLDLRCGIIEFGAVIDDLSNPLPLEELPRFHCYIVQKQYVGEPYAMSMHSKILKRIDDREEGFNYIYPSKLGLFFKKFLVKQGFLEKKGRVVANVAGKNFMSFDDRFLEEHTDFHKHVQFRSRVLDPAPLFYEPGDLTLPSLSLCLERAGLDPEVKHTAIEDSLDVIKLIRLKYLKEEV